MTFYDVLRTVCEKKHTSPSAVATAVGLSKSNITKWKAGQTPRLAVIIKMADYLGVSPVSLVRGVDLDTKEERLSDGIS